MNVVQSPQLKAVAHDLADLACEVDWVGAQVATPVLRRESRDCVQRLHRVARTLAREAGVTLYMDDEDGPCGPEEDAA
ncbi:MAG: hypothetical protein N2690_05745 [Rhodocyclaceae bacterium]|nr:hypothetical protein [Rhodocyclaceae bacterium]